MTGGMNSNPWHLALAFGAGGLLSLMVLFNGTLAQYGTLLFASWAPHATGTLAALAFLALLRPAKAKAARAPLWAYAGGLIGAFTVMATAYAMNSALALSGTIAIGLAGQMVFSLVADARGLFGLPVRRPLPRDWLSMALIGAGAVVLIGFGGAP